jgi:mono/diheme cytochrome c family protein
MKNFFLGFLTAIVLLAGCLFAFLRLGVANVNSDVAAPAWLDRLFHFAVHASVRRKAAGVQSPVAHSDADLIEGGMIYNDGCAGCHGALGRPRRKKAGFFRPPEFAYVGTRYSEPEAVWVIKHGIRRTAMSAYGASYTEKQVGNLAGFVRRMNDLPPAVLAALRSEKP